MTLAPIDPTNALAVSDYLTKARDWLATAVERTGPSEIAAAKAEIATAAEATKQLGLSKEIQDDAKEMVRRAEYALGKAIRKGQAEGTVATHGGGRRSSTGTPTLTSPSDFATKQELSGAGHGQPGIYALAEVDDDAFDEAIDAAKAEGNLSRANVARKAAEQSGKPARATRRAPLPDFARDAADDLLRIAERLERIANDDRFAENREAIAHRAAGSLNRSLQLIQEFKALLDNEATS